MLTDNACVYCQGEGWYIIQEPKTKELEKKICQTCTDKNIKTKVIAKLQKITDAHIDLAKTIKNKLHDTLCTEFENSGIWLYGETGAGKTHTALLCIFEYLRKNYEIAIDRTRPGELRQLWAGQFEESEFRQRLKKITTANVLLIDDIDKFGKPTERQSQEIYDFFEIARSKNQKIFCTSNTNIKDFTDKMPVEFRSPLLTRLTGKNGLVKEYKYA